MAFTYLILNLVFIAIISVVFFKYLRKPTTTWWLVFISLVTLTAIFDSLIIGAGIVGYDPTKLLGLYIGLAPIEDFFYAILAAIIVPVLWKVFQQPNKVTEKEKPNAT